MRKSVLATLAVAASLTLAACGSSGDALPSGLQGKSAAQILLAAENAGVQSGFVLVSGQSVGTGLQTTAVIHAATYFGQESSIGVSGTVLARLTGHIVYFKADELYLKKNFKKPNSPYAGVWIAVPPTNAIYASAQSLTVSGNLVNIFPTAHLKIVGVTHVNGIKCVHISGQHSLTSSDKVDVYINYAKPYLPVQVKIRVTIGVTAFGQIQNYTMWGVQFVVTPPPVSIPIGRTNL